MLYIHISYTAYKLLGFIYLFIFVDHDIVKVFYSVSMYHTNI